IRTSELRPPSETLTQQSVQSRVVYRADQCIELFLHLGARPGGDGQQQLEIGWLGGQRVHGVHLELEPILEETDPPSHSDHRIRYAHWFPPIDLVPDEGIDRS